jgi:multiple sugar transport system permease protein
MRSLGFRAEAQASPLENFMTINHMLGKINKGAKPYYHHMKVRRQMLFILLLLPALVWFLVLMLWPLVNMFYLSSVRWEGLALPKFSIGLDNFSRMFQDRNFLVASRNTGIHLLVVLPLVTPLGFMLGYFLSLRKPGYRVLRTIFFSPAMISVAAQALIFMGIYMQEGILNNFLISLGLDSWVRVWLANRSTALGAIIAIDIWGGIGFYGVLFFSSLSGISAELYEAAKLDGAGHWKMMWKIAFPLSIDFIGVVVMLQFLWVLSGAAQNVLLLTRGGPGNATLTLGYYLYEQAFLSQRLGYSQAIGVVILMIGIIGILLIRRISSRLQS